MTHIYLLFSTVIWPIVRVSFVFNSLGILAQGIERSILLFMTVSDTRHCEIRDHRMTRTICYEVCMEVPSSQDALD